MSDRSRLRLVIVQMLVASLLVTLFGRLWYLQVAAGEQYQQAASDNRIREVVTPAVRGQILDDRGRPLVNNRTALVVTVDRAQLSRQKDRGDAVLRRLAAVLRMQYADVKQRVQLCGPKVSKPCWNGSPYQPIPVTDRADTGMALQIMERREDFPGVTAEPQAVREFPKPQGANSAHLLGYLSPVTDQELNKQQALERKGGKDAVELKRTDQVGRAGLEQAYDAQLRGRPGILQVAVDHLGRVTGSAGETPAIPGNHLVTSIDAGLQAVTERELGNAIERARGKYDKITGRKYRADSGAAVVMDVRTGRVLAMASYPTYDPAVWIGGISAKEFGYLNSEKAGIPLISRATQGQFAPASTFKVISTSAAAESGFSLNGTYPCPSSFEVGNRSFRNYETRSRGNITLAQALEVSCDTVYYKIAYEMWLRDGGNRPRSPKDPMVTMAKAFRLGQETGIDLPGESSGRIADRAWKKAYWEQKKDIWCKRAKTGDPELAKTDPARAAFNRQLDRENCVDYWQFRAGDAVNFAIGQGETVVTPLQLARVYAAIANGGTLWVPRLGKAVVSPSGKVVEEIKPRSAGRVPVPASVLSYIRSALTQTTVSGTGAVPFLGFPLDKIPVATKTGTGEVFGKQTTSWFASFAPAKKPQYAVVMMVSQGGTGSGTSGPSVRKIYEALFGVDGSTVDPRKAVLPNGAPPTALPKIRPDGTVVRPAAFLEPPTASLRLDGARPLAPAPPPAREPELTLLAASAGLSRKAPR
jgi:penicillin-binding protein 2